MAITIREAIAISKIRLKYLKNFGSSILFLITTINKSKKNIIVDIAIKNADGSLTYFNGSETKSLIIPYG
ncbi:hypothetical protein ACXOTX_08940, partial [Streptococcus thermophilus]